jgi:transcriptional regulator with XRE-family HTH domain
MKSFKVYGKILDEVRQSKNMTVTELCENIISERTYYRYMKQDMEMKFDLFAKLAHRLGLEPYEVIHFSVFIRKGDPGVTRFIYRVHTRLFSDIDEIYIKLQTHHEELAVLDKLLVAYKQKYWYLINKITLDEYRTTLQQLMMFYRDQSLANVYVMSFFVLYFEQFTTNDIMDVAELAEHLLKFDYRLGVLPYAIHLDLFVEIVFGTNWISIDQHRRLADKYGLLLQHFQHKYFVTSYWLYYVYASYLDGKWGKVQNELYQTIISISIMFGGQQLREKFETIERVFQIQIKEFLVEYSMKYLMPNQFSATNI